MDAKILWELDRFVLNYKKSLSKNKRKVEQAQERAEALQNSILSRQPPASFQIPREPQADERNVPPSLPMQGEVKQIIGVDQVVQAVILGLLQVILIVTISHPLDLM